MTDRENFIAQIQAKHDQKFPNNPKLTEGEELAIYQWDKRHPNQNTSGLSRRDQRIADQKVVDDEQYAIDNAPILAARKKMEAAMAELSAEGSKEHAQFAAYLKQDVINPADPRAIDLLSPCSTGPKVSGEAEYAAWELFLDGLINSGVTFLKESSLEKLKTYLRVQVARRGVTFTVENAILSLERLYTLGVLQENVDLTGYAALRALYEPAPPAPPAPPKPDLDHLGSDNSEWRREVGAQWSAEVDQMFTAWTESLYQNFNYSFFADPNHVELTSRIGQYVTKWNLSLLRHETYNIIRRAFGKLGLMPLMLTDEERLADLIENSDMSDREVRKAIANHANILSGR